MQQRVSSFIATLACLIPPAWPAPATSSAAQPPGRHASAEGIDGGPGTPAKVVDQKAILTLTLTDGERLSVVDLDSFPSDCTYKDSANPLGSLGVLSLDTPRSNFFNVLATSMLDDHKTVEHEGVCAVADFLRSYLPERRELLQALGITDWQQLTPKQAILLSAEIATERMKYGEGNYPQPKSMSNARFAQVGPDLIPVHKVLIDGELPDGNGVCRNYVAVQIGIFDGLRQLQLAGQSKLESTRLFAESNSHLMTAPFEPGFVPGTVEGHAWLGVVCQTENGIYCLQLDPTWADTDAQGMDPAQTESSDAQLDHSRHRFLLSANHFLKTGLIGCSSLVDQLIKDFDRSYDQPCADESGTAVRVSPVYRNDIQLQLDHKLSHEMQVADWVIRLLTEHERDISIDRPRLNRFLTRYAELLEDYSDRISDARGEWAKLGKSGEDGYDELELLNQFRLELLVRVCDKRILNCEDSDQNWQAKLADLLCKQGCFREASEGKGTVPTWLRAFALSEMIGHAPNVASFRSQLPTMAPRPEQILACIKEKPWMRLPLVNGIEQTSPQLLAGKLQIFLNSPELAYADQLAASHGLQLHIQGSAKPEPLSRVLENLQTALSEEPELLTPAVRAVRVSKDDESPLFFYRADLVSVTLGMTKDDILDALRMHRLFTNRLTALGARTSMSLGLYPTEYESDRSKFNVPRGSELPFLKNLEGYFDDPVRQERFRRLSFLLDTKPNSEGHKLYWTPIQERFKRGFIPLDSSFFANDTYDPYKIDEFISHFLRAELLRDTPPDPSSDEDPQR